MHRNAWSVGLVFLKLLDVRRGFELNVCLRGGEDAAEFAESGVSDRPYLCPWCRDSIGSLEEKKKKWQLAQNLQRFKLLEYIQHAIIHKWQILILLLYCTGVFDHFLIDIAYFYTQFFYTGILVRTVCKSMKCRNLIMLKLHLCGLYRVNWGIAWMKNIVQASNIFTLAQ